MLTAEELRQARSEVDPEEWELRRLMKEAQEISNSWLQSNVEAAGTLTTQFPAAGMQFIEKMRKLGYVADWETEVREEVGGVVVREAFSSTSTLVFGLE